MSGGPEVIRAHVDLFLPGERYRGWRWLLLNIVGTVLGSYYAFTEHGLGVSFFFALNGTATVVTVIAMLPGRRRLELRADALVVREWPRTLFYRWSDIQEFVLVRFLGRDRIGINFRTRFIERSKQRANLRRLLGVEAVLPECYRHPARDLASLLEVEFATRTGTVLPPTRVHVQRITRAHAVGVLAVIGGALLGSLGTGAIIHFWLQAR